MRKSVSLMLSAALTFGSVASSYAAPLAKKYGAARAEAFPLSQEKLPDARLAKLPQRRTLESRNAVKGLTMVSSQVKAKNRRALRSATTARRAIAADTDLRGQVLYSANWDDNAEYGLYSLPKNQDDTFSLLYPMESVFTNGCDTEDGYFYGVDYFTFWGMMFVSVYTYETEDWTQLGYTEGTVGLIASDTALDPTTGEVYGCFYNDEGSGFVWGTIDYPGLTRTAIADIDQMLMGVAVDKNGQAYALGADAVFYKVDKATGELDPICTTDLPLYYSSGATFNDANNTFIASYSSDYGSGLAEIDVATGEVNIIKDFGEGDEEVCCVYIAKPLAEDKAPAVPELAVSCENGSMDVTVTLTMPTTLFDGTPVSGDSFTYTVLADDATVLEGSAVAGSVVTETVTLTTSGVTKFVATVANGAGSSPKAKASCYVGKGTPSAPGNVKLALADNVATLTWNAVTASSDGGYLDPAGVTYTVLDSEGNELQSGLTATTYTTTLTEPDAGYIVVALSVRADYDGKSSEASASNKVGLGALDPPLSMDMSLAENFNCHLWADLNEDGRTWTYDGSTTYYFYSSDNDADDWLFSPSVNLESGKIYQFSAVLASQSSYYPERFEIFAGRGATADDMELSLVTTTEISNINGEEFDAFIKPTVTGVYNVGFHACSDADSYFLRLLSYSIGAGMNADAPAAVTNATVKGDALGELKASVSFTAPTKDLSGNSLSGNLSVKVYRGGDLVEEVACTSGGNYSFDDTSVPEYGTYVYTFVPCNASGDGVSTSVTGKVGVNAPADPENGGGYETSTPGVFKLYWDAVTTDVEGNELPEGYVTYNLFTVVDGYLGDQINTEPVTDTEYTVTVDPLDVQDFVQFAIQAVNKDVGGLYNSLGLIAAGPAYSLPALISGSDSGYILGSSTDGASIGFGSSSLLPAADGDDSFVYVQFSNTGGVGSLLTGKYDLSVDNPAITFFIYKVADDDTNYTTVSVIKEGVTTQIASFQNGNLETGWNQVRVPLADYKNQTVQFLISGNNAGDYAYIAYDAIKIANNLKYDLSANSVSAPSRVRTDEEFDVAVKVYNEGSEATDVYTVNLYRDGEIVDSRTDRNGLAELESGTVVFKQTLGVADGKSVEFKAVVVYEADEDTQNNETGTVTVTRKASTLPGVTGLEGESTAEGNSLTWTDVVVGTMAVECTEDFESGDAFADDFGDWAFVDVDGAGNGGFSGYEIPGHPIDSAYSFFVFDASGDDWNWSDKFEGHSGVHYLASMFRGDGEAVDDWAISPELSGDAQTVSFYARSHSDLYPETIQVWYSTSNSTSPDDFVELVEYPDLPAKWTEYTVELPDGAKRFAIRSIAVNAFMLMVDDVTFVKLGGYDGELLGYNVYRDGVKVNDAPLAVASYLDTPNDDQAHTYNVTAVYDKGESEFSESVTIDQSGIASVFSAGLKVAVEDKTIVVSGTAGKLVTINAVDGRTVYSANGDARVPVTSAVYLVTVDRKTVKVIVR